MVYRKTPREASHLRVSIVRVAPELSDYHKQDQVPMEENSKKGQTVKRRQQRWRGGLGVKRRGRRAQVKEGELGSERCELREPVR